MQHLRPPLPDTACMRMPSACCGRPDAESAMNTDEVFESVWDAIEPSSAEAAHMKMRSELMIAIQEAVAGWGLTQAEPATQLAVTQPRLNDLLRGRIG